MTNYSRLIKEVRSQRIQEITIPGTENDPLLGECFKNAIALADKFAEIGEDPYIVSGGLDFSSEPAPDTMKKAYQRHQHHFWVFVNGIHLDIAGEWLTTSKEGTPVNSSTPPDHYVVYHKTKYNPNETQDPELYL